MGITATSSATGGAGASAGATHDTPHDPPAAAAHTVADAGAATATAKPENTAVKASADKPAQSVADRVRELTSYSLTDLSVTAKDQRESVDLLKADPNLNATLRDLASDPNYFGTSSLTRMMQRVDEPAMRRDLLDRLARGSDDANANAVRAELDKVDTSVVSGTGGAAAVTVNGQVWQTRFNLVREGMPVSGPAFDRAPYADLISPDPSAPFTGSGATGVNPTAVSVPLGDQIAMLADRARGQQSATTVQYDNPLYGLDTYLKDLPLGDRTRQAELFLKQPIASPFGEVWGDRPPSRAQVIEAAAEKYNLDPATLGGFLLAEQRDQSTREDAKDYASAVAVGHNSSVGLGQLVVSTATRHQLLSDSVNPGTVRQLNNGGVARMLSDDAANIFATAKYIRQTADAGSKLSMAELQARTKKESPHAPPVDLMFWGMDPARYAENSSKWPPANVTALGSEYTSRPWDGAWFKNWGDFVSEAHKDVVNSGVFR